MFYDSSIFISVKTASGETDKLLLQYYTRAEGIVEEATYIHAPEFKKGLLIIAGEFDTCTIVNELFSIFYPALIGT